MITYIGLLAETYAELDGRELKCLAIENDPDHRTAERLAELFAARNVEALAERSMSRPVTVDELTSRLVSALTNVFGPATITASINVSRLYFSLPRTRQVFEIDIAEVGDNGRLLGAGELGEQREEWLPLRSA